MKIGTSIHAIVFAIAGLWSTQGFAQVGTIECRTDSRGYSFSELGRDYSYTRESLVRRCQSHPATSNSDCDYNVTCSGSRLHRISCDTSSRGLGFRAEDFDSLRARDIAVQQCKSHPSTVNADCEYNVRCTSSGPILRPIPQPVPPIIVRPRAPVIRRPLPPVVRHRQPHHPRRR